MIDEQCRAGNLANADKWKIAFAILVRLLMMFEGPHKNSLQICAFQPKL